MWKFDLVAAINIVAGAVLAVLLTLVKDWLWDHLRPQRGVRIEAIEGARAHQPTIRIH